MQVTESFNISERGVGIFLDQQDFSAPASPFKVKVTLPTGEQHIYVASIEYARKVPPGEIKALFIKNIKSGSIPVGSTLEILHNECV